MEQDFNEYVDNNTEQPRYQPNRQGNNYERNNGSYSSNNNSNSYGNSRNNSYGSNNNGGIRTQNNSGSNNNYRGGQRPQFNRQNREEYNGPIELYKAYVGTGNREAPADILDRFYKLGKELEQHGYTLRTGAFEGPDQAFEASTSKHELYIPWKGFNNKESKFSFNTKPSLEIAAMFHPTFDGLKPAIQAFLACNARMLLGKDLKSPALFIVCWSEDGAETTKDRISKTGNVGHLIAIASAMKIKVFNFARPDAEQRLKDFLEINHGQEKTEQPINNSTIQGTNNDDFF